MTDLLPHLLPPAESPLSQRRGARLSKNGKPLGRPPGAPNKGSMQLGKYLEAQYGGLTPGQQLAELAMVKPAEIRRAKAAAKERGIPTRGMSDLQLAFMVKADDLAKALVIDRASAYAAQIKTLGELMPYVHQRQAQASEDKSKAPATVFMIPADAGAEAQSLPDFSVDDDADDGVEILEDLGTGGREVGRPQSDD